MTPENEPKDPQVICSRLGTLLKPVEALVLDFDGLLADSEPFHFKAYNTVFERYGHSLDPDEYWVEFTSKGTGIQGEIDRHNLELPASVNTIRQEKFKEYSDFCNNGAIPLFPAAQRFIELAKKRFTLAIASGSWEHDIRAILKHADADGLVTTILGKAPDKRREKPAPDIFIEAASILNLPPEKCLVIEDALKGLNAAREAGMPCLIVRNKLNMKIDFSETDLVIPDLDHLVTHLEQKT
ncbi:MAG: HAD family phosphatase [Candidatus Nitronauta litoralis]|uniref:HAD family phosphatase n=1 Tax=Candidatus Nitronauta litoralis TaxID=2705533 RepID=A0A7T0BWN8_9BACT|nr:MAG: HAD family phosphatase [Candidatus Nitronauta litoralis]